MAWDGQVTMLYVAHRFVRPWKPAEGCIRNVSFDSPTPAGLSIFQSKGAINLSGVLLEARRSVLTIAEDSSWDNIKDTLDIWRVGNWGQQVSLRLHSHCFILLGDQDQSSDPIGIVQFDDLSNAPETLTCLLVDDEMLIDGSLDSILASTRAILNKRYLRRYWLLVLEPEKHVQRTYKRLGVAVATCRRIDKGKTLGLPLHKLGERAQVRLI